MGAGQYMASLFEPFTIRGVKLKNRIGLSPMCQYSAEEGLVNDWHIIHLGSRAIGGVGLIIVEATAVEARGRITPADLGIWDNRHVAGLNRIVNTVHAAGAVVALQIAHAGRKASTAIPSQGGVPLPMDHGGWQVVGPSEIPFTPDHPNPHILNTSEIRSIENAFAEAAVRAVDAEFDIVEIHAAHGYLISSFLSPLANRRTDKYGGSFHNRCRFLLETVQSVRAEWPEEKPLLVRLSCTDWKEGGWTIEETVELARLLKNQGVDIIDCSSGGNVPSESPIRIEPGYQVPFSERVRNEAGVATAAVGMITNPDQAEAVIANGQADLVLLGRELLRNPYWAHHAALELHADAPLPIQYIRAFKR
jgi:2,4-dienoyl-CoA reductase-like NADH-dependent reductase (Old Yellow Enzyme family)